MASIAASVKSGGALSFCSSTAFGPATTNVTGLTLWALGTVDTEQLRVVLTGRGMGTGPLDSATLSRSRLLDIPLGHFGTLSQNDWRELVIPFREFQEPPGGWTRISLVNVQGPQDPIFLADDIYLIRPQNVTASGPIPGLSFEPVFSRDQGLASQWTVGCSFNASIDTAVQDNGTRMLFANVRQNGSFGLCSSTSFGTASAYVGLTMWLRRMGDDEADPSTVMGPASPPLHALVGPSGPESLIHPVVMDGPSPDANATAPAALGAPPRPNLANLAVVLRSSHNSMISAMCQQAALAALRNGTSDQITGCANFTGSSGAGTNGSASANATASKLTPLISYDIGRLELFSGLHPKSTTWGQEPSPGPGWVLITVPFRASGEPTEGWDQVFIQDTLGNPSRLLVTGISLLKRTDTPPAMPDVPVNSQSGPGGDADSFPDAPPGTIALPGVAPVPGVDVDGASGRSRVGLIVGVVAAGVGAAAIVFTTALILARRAAARRRLREAGALGLGKDSGSTDSEVLDHSSADGVTPNAKSKRGLAIAPWLGLGVASSSASNSSQLSTPTRTRDTLRGSAYSREVDPEGGLLGPIGLGPDGKPRFGVPDEFSPSKGIVGALGSGTGSGALPPRVRSSSGSAGSILRRAGSGSGGAAGALLAGGPPLPKVEEIDYKEVKILELLGTGAFGCVYRAEWRGKFVAVKAMHAALETGPSSRGPGGLRGHAASRSKEIENFKQEVQMLARLSHPRVIELYGACLCPPQVMIVEELAEGGSLFARLHEGPGGKRVCRPLPLVELLPIALDIADALAYLHPTVVHRDLKSHNVLLDGKGRAKVCDFGIARYKVRLRMHTDSIERLSTFPN